MNTITLTTPDSNSSTHAARHGRRRLALVALLALATFAAAGESANAAGEAKYDKITVEVVDQFGDPIETAVPVALACPYVDDGTGSGAEVPDCGNPVATEVDEKGRARLSLDPDERYNVFAFVADPDPAWACPGYELNGIQLYLSAVVTGLGADLPSKVTATIVEPTPYDCVTVSIVDGTGAPLQNTGLLLCAHEPGSSVCIGDWAAPPTLAVDPALEYDLTAFAFNTGWPCGWISQESGDSFHFSEQETFTADQLVAGITLVIVSPSAESCPT